MRVQWGGPYGKDSYLIDVMNVVRDETYRVFRSEFAYSHAGVGGREGYCCSTDGGESSAVLTMCIPNSSNTVPTPRTVATPALTATPSWTFTRRTAGGASMTTVGGWPVGASVIKCCYAATGMYMTAVAAVLCE